MHLQHILLFLQVVVHLSNEDLALVLDEFLPSHSDFYMNKVCKCCVVLCCVVCVSVYVRVRVCVCVCVCVCE